MIEDTIARLAVRLAGQRAEIIVVENGSTDDTYPRCSRLAEKWLNPTVSLSVLRSQKGMGNALRMGAMASRGSAVLLTADDLPFGFDDLDQADRLAAAGLRPPVLVGSKAHRDSLVNRGLSRASLTSAFAIARRVVLGMKTGDSQGTILIDGELLHSVAPSVVEPGFLFTTELIHIVERMGFIPTEVPVTLRRDHSGHKSRIATSDAAKMALGLMRLRLRHRNRWRPESMRT